MGLILRNTKGSPLTATEMDNNLTYLETIGSKSGSVDIITGSINYANTGVIKLDGQLQASNVGGVITLSVQGAVGSSGTNGTSGSSGSGGSSGSSGTSGATGSTGTSGSSGSSGSSGTAGSSGTSGATGSTGSAGSSGTSGFSGDRFASVSNTPLTISNSGTYSLLISSSLSWSPGQQMLIADATGSGEYLTIAVTSYNAVNGQVTGSWVANSGTGTYSWWAINTVGAPGQQGSAGSAGTSGTSGTGGTSGTAGSSGVNGLNGSDGTSGSTGSSGSSGTTGTAGSSGTTGSSGLTGSSGTSGTAGAAFPYDGRITQAIISGSMFVSGAFYVTGSIYGDNILARGVRVPTSSVDIVLSEVSGFSSYSSSVSSRLSTSSGGIFTQTGSSFNTQNNIGVSGSMFISGSLTVFGPIRVINIDATGSLVSSSNQVILENTIGFQSFSSSVVSQLNSGAGGIKPIGISYLGAPIISAVENINFTGNGVSVSNVSSSITVTITTGSGAGGGGAAGTSGTNGTSGTSAGSALLTVKSSIQEFSGIAALTFSGSGVTLQPSGSGNGVLVTITGGSGAVGSAGSSGTSGVNGSSGFDGIPGSSGTSATSGTSGQSGSSGISVLGSNGTSGSSGTSGIQGTGGTSGTSGLGSNGTSGNDGSHGTSGLGVTLSVRDTGITTISNLSALTFSGSFQLTPSGSGGATISISSNLNVTGAPGGTVSSSQQIRDFGYALTGSNNWVGLQTITGSLIVSGSQTTISSSVWITELQVPYSWSLRLPLAEGFMLVGSPEGFMTAIRTSSLSISGSGGGTSILGGPFTQTGSYFSAATNLQVSGSMIISGSVTASSFAILDPGTPEIASVTDINLNAGNAVRITSSSLKLANFTDSQTGSIVAENGALIYNSTKNKIGAYINGVWVHDAGTFPYIGVAIVTGSSVLSGSSTIVGNQTISGSLVASGSNINLYGAVSVNGPLALTGSLGVSANVLINGATTITGSVSLYDIQINDVLKITPRNSTPSLGSVPTGSIIISASVDRPKPWMWDGWDWQPFY